MRLLKPPHIRQLILLSFLSFRQNKQPRDNLKAISANFFPGRHQLLHDLLEQVQADIGLLRVLKSVDAVEDVRVRRLAFVVKEDADEGFERHLQRERAAFFFFVVWLLVVVTFLDSLPTQCLKDMAQMVIALLVSDDHRFNQLAQVLVIQSYVRAAQVLLFVIFEFQVLAFTISAVVMTVAVIVNVVVRVTVTMRVMAMTVIVIVTVIVMPVTVIVTMMVMPVTVMSMAVIMIAMTVTVIMSMPMIMSMIMRMSFTLLYSMTMLMINMSMSILSILLPSFIFHSLHLALVIWCSLGPTHPQISFIMLMMVHLLRLRLQTIERLRLDQTLSL